MKKDISLYTIYSVEIEQGVHSILISNKDPNLCVILKSGLEKLGDSFVKKISAVNDLTVIEKLSYLASNCGESANGYYIGKNKVSTEELSALINGTKMPLDKRR